MVSRRQPFSDRFLAMSSDERLEYLEAARVVDRSALPEDVRRRSEAMLEEARRNFESSLEEVGK